MAQNDTDTAPSNAAETAEQLQQRVRELNDENASRRHALKQLAGERDALRAREAERLLDEAARTAITNAIAECEGAGRAVEDAKADALRTRLRESLSPRECVAWNGTDADLSEQARETLQTRAADLVQLASHEKHVVPPPRPHGEGPLGRTTGPSDPLKNSWDADCQPNTAGRGRAMLRETAEKNRDNLDFLAQT
jgi:hypothetical protein